MRYTKYLMSDKFIDINSLRTDNKYLELPLVLIKIPVATIGVLTTLGFLPLAIIVDEIRNTKCSYIHFKRRRRMTEKILKIN